MEFKEKLLGKKMATKINIFEDPNQNNIDINK